MVDLNFHRLSVVYYAATWGTFKPKLEKIKNSAPEKDFYISGNGTFLPPQKNLIKLAPKNLIKLFYTLNKTPLGETVCLSNLYYLLASPAFSFLIHDPFPNTVT